MTLTNGILAGAGTVTINNCAISNDAGSGIGVFNGAKAVVVNSTISNCGGSGVDVEQSFSSLTMIGCTVADNTTFTGAAGGLNMFGGNSHCSATLIDSTFSGNASVNTGAMAMYSADLTAVNCTITGNFGNNQSAINGEFNFSFTMRNSIVWNNINTRGGSELGFDGGNPVSFDYTLGGASAGGVGDIVGVSDSPAILGPLGNNGGPTQTMVPVADSFPIGAGGNLSAVAQPVAAGDGTVTVANGSLFAAASLPTLTSG